MILKPDVKTPPVDVVRSSLCGFVFNYCFWLTQKYANKLFSPHFFVARKSLCKTF